MKYSAEDIATQRFESKFRGEDPIQVREFLASVAQGWADLSAEVKSLRETVANQKLELREFRQRQKSLQDTLEMARTVSESVKDKAEHDAEMLIAETELKVSKMQAAAQAEIDSATTKVARLREQRIRFEAELRRTLELHSDLLDTYQQAAEWDDDSVRSEHPV